MYRHERGFTLIELFVVLASITVIAAILLPVFSNARDKRRKTICLSNAKQIGAAILMYSQDYDLAIVPWVQPSGGVRDSMWSDRRTWVDLLHPYVKDADPARVPLSVNANVQPSGIWRCPAFNPVDFVNSTNDPTCSGPGTVSIDELARQYYANYGIIFPNPPGPQGACTSGDPSFNYPGSDPLYSDITGNITQIRRPAETVSVTDGATYLSNLSNNLVAVGGGCTAANAHGAGGTIAFFDGHAKFVVGNSERRESIDSGGCVYKTYYSIDR